MEPKTTSLPTRPSKAYSCVRCFDRKVKCDKQHPCAGCVRAKVECIFRVPAAPRRRQRKIQDEAVLARLRHYEELLREKGLDPATPSSVLTRTETASTADDAEQSPQSAAKTNESSISPRRSNGQGMDDAGRLPSDYLPFRHGRLIAEEGKSRFIEKYFLRRRYRLQTEANSCYSNLWTTLSAEVSQYAHTALPPYTISAD